MSGTIIGRYGARLHAPAAALEKYANSWVIATSASGDVFAAHSFKPLLRRYDATGRLQWENRVTVASLQPLDRAREAAEAEVRSNPQTCCIEAKLVRFASDVLVGANEVAVRFGLNPTLEVFGDDGEWKRAIGFDVPANSHGWVTAGIAIVDGGIVACELSRLALYPASPEGSFLRGSVLDTANHPIGNARVSVRALNGSLLSATTTPAGQFRIGGLPATTAGEIRVAADGFLDFSRSGVFSEILSLPIRLDREPRQCVVVTNEAKKPITRFALEVGRLATGATTVTRGGGRSREFSAEDGKACLDTPVAPPLYVRISADGYATREITVSEPRVVEVRLAREARIRARVQDQSHVPVADAHLYIQVATTEKRATFAIADDLTTTTTRDGLAELNRLAADEYRIVVEHPSFVRLEKNIRLDVGENDVDLLLERGSEIAVVVTSKGQRVPDAVVRAEGQGQNLSHPLECTTAADGTCTIAAVPPGRYLVRAEAARRSRGQQTLVIAPGARSQSVDVRLDAAIALTGRIRGMEHYGDTELDFQIGKPGVPVVTVPIAHSGEFRINEAPSGRVNVWINERGANSTLLYKNIDIPDVPEYDVTIDLPPPITLRGRVTSSRRGCGNCKLSLELLGSQVGRPLRQARVNGDGSFIVRLPAAGSYRATATDPASHASLIRIEQITADATTNFDLGGSSLAVKVLTAAGDPARSALVDVATDAGTVGSLSTDDTGSGRFEALSAGNYRVTAALGGRATSRKTEVDGETNLELRLPDNPPLQLRVIDAVSGLPLPMISTRVISARGETTISMNVIGNNGVFVMPGFAAEPLTIVILARGYAFKTLRGVTISSTPVIVPTTPGNRSFAVQIGDNVQPCKFEVRDAAGNPVALSLDWNPGPVPLFVRNAVFYGMEPGAYTAVLYDCGGKPSVQQMRLAPGLTPTVQFP